MKLQDLTEIQLFNRYGKHLYLKQNTEKLEGENPILEYKLCGEKSDDLMYIRYGYNNDETIEYIDPEGGPMIMVNNFYLLSESYKLMKIEMTENNEFILTFEKTKKEV